MIVLLQVFGGGTKPLLDANVQKIVDAGFTEEQAENALRYTKNNVERALKILQKRDNSEGRGKDKPKDQEQTKRKGRNKETDDDVVPVKPTAKVSLFDFLEDKLPSVPQDKEKTSRQYNNNHNDDRNDRGYQHRDKFSAKNNSRPHGSRYDKHRSDNRGHFTDNHQAHRDDRKFQTQAEKPPRFQRKIEERNKQQQLQQQQQQQRQQQLQQQANNVSNHSMNSYNSSNSYQSQQTHYHEMNSRDRNMNDNMQQQHQHQQQQQQQHQQHQQHQQSYRNSTSMDALAEAAAGLNLLNSGADARYQSPPEQYKQYGMQEMGYRRSAAEQYPRRQNGYLEAQQQVRAGADENNSTLDDLANYLNMILIMCIVYLRRSFK